MSIRYNLEDSTSGRVIEKVELEGKITDVTKGFDIPTVLFPDFLQRIKQVNNVAAAS